MDGITNISANGPIYSFVHAPEAARQQTTAQEVPQTTAPQSRTASDLESMQALERQLAAIAPQINERLEFSYYRELGQVVVKIIDRETDTVIKELPPTEFQRVHLALREAIGLLIDKKV
jgi:flagellar protein FlaG